MYTVLCILMIFYNTFRGLVNVFIIIDLFGCCCVYINFVSNNIKQVTITISNNVHEKEKCLIQYQLIV